MRWIAIADAERALPAELFDRLVRVNRQTALTMHRSRHAPPPA